MPANVSIDYRHFYQHLEHITSGVWADKRCKVCKMKWHNQVGIRYDTQENTPEGLVRNTIIEEHTSKYKPKVMVAKNVG